MSVSMIAAIGRKNELGKGNDLIWHFKEDMQFFKKTTVGNTVIMGRKTFESLPKALPNRRNIVISTNENYIAQGAEVVTDIKTALEIAENENVFIIGGGKIYSQFLEYADKLYITEIDAQCDEADTFFPCFDKSNYIAQQLTDYAVDGVSFKHMLYTRK